MSNVVRYLIAIAATAIAVALTAALPEFLAPMRFLFLWSAVLVTAVVAGTGPALLAVALSLLSASLLVFKPYGVPTLDAPLDLIRLAVFGLFATLLGIAVGTRRRAEQLAADTNVRLLAEIQERRRHEENSAFINRASEVLATSLSHSETMNNLVRLCVPLLGDWCAVHIGSDEHYERLAVAHADPAKMRLLDELGRIARPSPEQDAIYQVLTTARPMLVPEFSKETMLALAGTSRQYDLLSKLGFRSWIIAPMVARGRTLGALTIVAGESGRRYTEADVPLVEDLARRAAVAIDNARLYEAAEAANRAKDEFLATLSHELRTPLTAISGWAHMLDMGVTDEATTKLALGTIIRSAKAQAELIDDLLDLSRVVAGTLRLNIGDVDLGTLIREVALAAHPAADAKSIALDVETPEAAVIVRGDERRVRQIVWNLLTNAVKFTDRGRVRIVLSFSEATARVEVSDTGRGIDAAFLPHVWDRFRQADSSTSREFGGLGLGLAVVKHLVEVHGGTVRAQSPGLGQGATFTVELPLVRTSQDASPASVVPQQRPLSGRRILVVDDDDDARLVLAAMLTQAGADVATADGAASAMREFERDRVDLVLTDVAMPAEDGYSLVQRLHAVRAVPVVAVSAIGTGSDDRRRALTAGCAEFMRKPVDPDELVATILRFV